MWEVTNLEVETTTSGNKAANLFANDLMQVAVITKIKAIKPDTREPYTLSPSELASIKLVEYFDPSREISNGWSYTITENSYEHGYPLTASQPSEVRESEPHAEYQIKWYWVSTTKIDDKNIGASIRQPDGNVIHTGPGSKFDSRVVLTGKPPTQYGMDDIEVVQENTATGKIPYLFFQVEWDQDNYYVTSKKYPFRTAETHSYWGDPSEPTLKYCFAHYTGDNSSSRLSYIWDMGDRQTKKVGRVFDSVDATADITVNQRENALCLTRWSVDFNGKLFGRMWYFDSWFKIFDVYGNSGIYYVTNEDYGNKIKIQTSRLASHSDSHCVGAEPVLVSPADVPPESFIVKK
ncbi:hypothetical protein BP00DRAFT_20408 [Aspergillus indologenus CBS 114.80]|uniref:Uncharacterized protein n=1 Tax=Aspergillus indologenus CBS 114.80 TaxID=1450541 RepID=A0A2V5I0N2_9EURO|nr:hypothetical protein BP00DRAFT_20408 [Aspergillus indologenus CBS 114.80]